MKVEYVCERSAAEVRIADPAGAYAVLKRYTKKRQEHFIVVTLDGAHRVIATRVVSIGTANRTMVTARDVFFRAIQDNACAVMVAHNHPSGSLVASPEDDAITERMAKSGEILGIPVLDHLIISKTGYYSYRNEGRIE